MLLSQAAYWCPFYFNNISLDLQIVSGLLRCYFANLQRCCCTVRPCTTTPETVKMFSVFCRSSVAIRHAVFLLFQTCPAAFVWTPYLHYKFEETVTFAYPVIAFSSVGYQIFIFTVPVCVCATLRFLLEMKWWVERWRLPNIVYLPVWHAQHTESFICLISGPKPAPSCEKAFGHAHVQMPALCPYTLPGKEKRHTV